MKIVVSGTTGVGKSTTVNLIKNHYKKEGKEVIIVGELVVDNPYFDLYFEKIEDWGFIAQLDFLMQRFKQWFYIEEKIKDDDNKVIIYDRHFLEDLIFAELKFVRNNTNFLLTKAYSILYEELLKKIEEYQKPDFFILLKATFDTIKYRQFDRRGRTQEERFNNKYWQDLYYRYYASKKYKNIFKKYSKSFIEMDTDDLTPEEVKNKVIKYIENRAN